MLTIKILRVFLYPILCSSKSSFSFPFVSYFDVWPTEFKGRRGQRMEEENGRVGNDQN